MTKVVSRLGAVAAWLAMAAAIGVLLQMGFVLALVSFEHGFRWEDLLPLAILGGIILAARAVAPPR